MVRHCRSNEARAKRRGCLPDYSKMVLQPNRPGPVQQRQLRLYESEQIRVDHVCVRRAHAVWKARVYLERAVLEQVDLK